MRCSWQECEKLNVIAFLNVLAYRISREEEIERQRKIWQNSH